MSNIKIAQAVLPHYNLPSRSLALASIFMILTNQWVILKFTYIPISLRGIPVLENYPKHIKALLKHSLSEQLWKILPFIAPTLRNMNGFPVLCRILYRITCTPICTVKLSYFRNRPQLSLMQQSGQYCIMKTYPDAHSRS
jgi:hypothetical protein